jgi:hypothetical protein
METAWVRLSDSRRNPSWALASNEEDEDFLEADCSELHPGRERCRSVSRLCRTNFAAASAAGLEARWHSHLEKKVLQESTAALFHADLTLVIDLASRIP